MGGSLFSVDILLHDTILKDTNGRKDIERVLVTGINTIENQAHDARSDVSHIKRRVGAGGVYSHLLPRRTSLVPKHRLLQVDDIANVLHDTVEGTCGKHLVFVVISDGNKQLSVSVVHGGAQIVSILEGEIIGITSGGGVCVAISMLAGGEQ